MAVVRELLGIEWDLTEEIVEELLYNDMDDESCIHAPQCSGTSSGTSACLRTPADIMACIDTEATLSSIGENYIQQWIKDFSENERSSAVICHYPLLCQKADTFFNEDLPANHSPKLLLDIMNAIAKPGKRASEPVCGEVGKYESETLEYVGGYTLKKAYSRFSRRIINSLCSDAPQGALISMMERKTGALLYPSEEYLYFLQYIYIRFTKESSRNPKEINFGNVVEEVLRGQYYHSFINKVCDICEDEEKQEDIEAAISYIVGLVIRVLSHSFAKKLFQRLYKKVNSGATSLRDQLQGLPK